jgi:hypothetical protein
VSRPRRLFRRRGHRGAVDAAGRTGETDEAAMRIHVLRASDGSHYVAFSVTPRPDTIPQGPVVLYVRLATASGGATTLAERSVVRQWLQGSRIDPRLLPRRGMAIGEMPALGAGSIGVRSGASVGSADLRVMDLERERSRQRREEEDARRRSELEGASAAPSGLFPFEDFDLGPINAQEDGTRAIQRALTAGPGRYDLFVAWADASQRADAPIHIVRRSVQLAPAGTDFGITGVIVADRISARQTPYTALEQRSHPYSIGATEIVPARDAMFNPTERLAIAFQLVNPTSSAAGKPDVIVELRVVRLQGARETPVAALSPLRYDATTLPPEFDARIGQPLIAAMAAPLSSLSRGDYKLLITAIDRLSSSVVNDSITFRIVGTPASLLAEAPALGERFELGDALDHSIIEPLIERLATGVASPPLARALNLARTGRFGELLIEEPVSADEQGVRGALTGLALLSLGDFGAITQFERALQQGVPADPLQYLIGVARALQNRDADALRSWESARAAGLKMPALDRLTAEAYLRQRDFARAARAVEGTSASSNRAVRTIAAVQIATRRETDAEAILVELLTKQPDDQRARWLLLHSLYLQFVNGRTDVADRLREEGRRYIEHTGPHANLAAEWLAVVGTP